MASRAAELLATAQETLAAGAYDDALSAATASLEEEDLARSHRTLGDLYSIDDRYAEAQHEWELAFRKLRDEGAWREAAQVAIELARLHANMFGHPSAGAGWVERARLLLERLCPCVEWGYLELAYMACERPDTDELLAAAERALTIALEHGDSNLEAQALADSGLALVTQGRTREGFSRLDAALAAISAGEVSPIAASISFCSMLTACDRAGDVRRAEEWTGIVSGVLAGLGNKPRALHVHCRVAYGSVLYASGRWPEAEALMIEALGPAGSASLSHRALTVAHLADLRIDQGRIAEAALLLAPFEDRLTSCGPLARVHLRRGQPALAEAVLRRGLREMVGDALRACSLLTLLVEVYLSRGAFDDARATADELAALAAGVDIGVVRAEAAVAAGRVLAATADRPAAIASFEDAKAHLAGDERPFQLGLIRIELARARAAAGDRPGAITEARAALACFERLGATHARDEASALLRGWGETGRTRPHNADELAATLTRREREVLKLISQGLTNAEIAQRLFISAKTAEHHVGRALSKLGVRSRAEAAALAVRLAATTEL
jgi:DNA-binding CsgD family transcriptional regulator